MSAPSTAMASARSAPVRMKKLVPLAALPFRFEIVSGVGHFITDEAPDIVTADMLEHIAAHP